MFASASGNVWLDEPVHHPQTHLPALNSLPAYLTPPPNQDETTQICTHHQFLPVPRLILGTKKKMFRCLGGLVPSSSTTPQLRCLAAKWRCNRTGRRKKAPSSSRSLIAAITTFASRTLHKMMKRKRNAFELTEPLQDVWGNCKSPKLAFNIYFFSSPRFNLPSRVNPCNLQWHLLMFSRPQCV